MREKNVILKNKVIFVTGPLVLSDLILLRNFFVEVQPVHIVGIDNIEIYYDVSV